jgi:hypothetical protein
MRNIRKKVKESRNIDTEIQGSLPEPEIHNRSRYGSAMKGLPFCQLLNDRINAENQEHKDGTWFITFVATSTENTQENAPLRK